AGRRNVGLDQHDAPGPVEHAQREAALRAGYLVVIKLHRVDGAAAELIVLRVRPKDRSQQNAGACALWMPLNFSGTTFVEPCGDVHFFLPSFSPHMPLPAS